MKQDGSDSHGERSGIRNATIGSDNASSRGAIEGKKKKKLPFLQKLKGLSLRVPKIHEDSVQHSIMMQHKQRLKRSILR